MRYKYSGIWFYGLSGSGKTFASRYVEKKIPKSFLIDGDIVRKTLSTDLDYSLKSRKKQIRRVYSIAEICTINKFFPIISTVFIDHHIIKKCKKKKFLVINICRNNFEKIINSHKTYKNKKNIVGKDIKLNDHKTTKVINPGDKTFCKNLNLVMKYLKKKDI